ncbi:hypothetical protein EV360DRAFT_66548 [Lentinula raphanica]|nr:hypothetical protein EV360DRAFT_66548 [Lentinula raphanica]
MFFDLSKFTKISEQPRNWGVSLGTLEIKIFFLMYIDFFIISSGDSSLALPSSSLNLNCHVYIINNMHLLLPLDLHLLSFRFSRSLLLAACLLNTFVASLSCELQVEKWETTGDGTLSAGHPASLGSLYFPTLDYINKVISASLATLFFNLIIEFQVSEHRLKDHHRTGGVELHVGHEVQQFHPFLGRPSIQTHHLLDSFVHFRNTDAMKRAFSNTQVLCSKLGRDLPLPDWFHDLPLKPENLQTPPDYALPWLKLRAFILLMSEQDGGWTHHTGIKAITQVTLEEFEGVMKNQLIPLLKRKNNQKDCLPAFELSVIQSF